jgi:hypothetical protein
VPAHCSLVLGEEDSGRRLLVQPGRTTSVSLPDDARHSPPDVSDVASTGVLTTLRTNGHDATYRAAVPGLAAISSAVPDIKGPPTTWEVEIRVAGAALMQPVFTSATTG